MSSFEKTNKTLKKERKRTWYRRLEEAKKKHRPTLSDWGADGFSSKRANDFINYRDRTINGQFENNPRIDRVHCSQLSPMQFINLYEQPCRPVIIGDIPVYENWSAVKEWTSWKRLKKSLGKRMFKVGEDDDGYKVKVKFKYFLKYMDKNQDDSPLYVFDGNYDDDEVSNDSFIFNFLFLSINSLFS